MYTLIPTIIKKSSKEKSMFLEVNHSCNAGWTPEWVTKNIVPVFYVKVNFFC